MRVLQIEDDEPTAQAVAQALITKGFLCDTAGFGEQAVGLATQNHYDLILLDIMLPDMDGHEVLRRLRDADIHTPVIIQSALIGDSGDGKSDNLGVIDRLTKPFSSYDLQDSVAAILERAGSEDGGQVDEDGKSDKIARRRHKRITTLKSGLIALDDSDRAIRCLVVNMSEGGCALQLTEKAEIPEVFVLKFENGSQHRCLVCWRHANKLGVMFVQSPS